jgi:hypothetical protein
MNSSRFLFVCIIPYFYTCNSFACCLLHAGFFFSLFFDFENGGNMVLRNVDRLSLDYMALHPRDEASQSHRRENFKFNISL